MRLSSEDMQMMAAALRPNGGYHLATKWYLQWEPLDYQWAFHHIPIGNTTILGGIAVGKTTMVSASNVIDCITLPGFRALNASVTAKQSQLSFDMVHSWIENNKRFERLIKDVTLRPFPKIDFYNQSFYEFRTAGQGAKFIRGHEYDRGNYDEAGLDDTNEAIRVLRGRLRGSRFDGTPRMARLDATGTPSAAFWWRERFEMGFKGTTLATPENLKYYFSMRIPTYANTKLQRSQIELMEKEYPAELAKVELGAEFPDWGLSTFPNGHVMANFDAGLYDEVIAALYPDNVKDIKPGYSLEELPHIGVTLIEKPFRAGRLYVMAGDPGVDSPPKRNTPCIIVVDATDRPYEVVYFDWRSGRGSYDAFLQRYKYCIEKYGPIAKGVDTTGTQKAINELGFENYGIVTDEINFGGVKEELINSLLTAIVSHWFRIPRIEGLQTQLLTYKREDDKPAEQVPQDCVMTLAMVSYLCRRLGETHRDITQSKPNNYRPRTGRSKRGRTR